MYGMSYAIPTAWQIVYLNIDGSLDVYDYREYRFSYSSPSNIFPYHLGTDYPLYGRSLKYPIFNAYVLDIPLDRLTSPVDIRENWQHIKNQLEPLVVDGRDGQFDIYVPDTDHLYILVHYKVSSDITVVGKDFARTYYELPTIGKSDVEVSDYRLAFVLPTSLQCTATPVYDENDSKCPCFVVHRFLPDGGKIGVFHKGCDFVLFTVNDLDVRTRQEVDAIYLPSVLSPEARSALAVDQSYEEVKKWQEANSLDPSVIYRYMMMSIASGVVLIIVSMFIGWIGKGVYFKYYLRQLSVVPATMDMPHDDVYRSYFFSTLNLRIALAGKDPYDIPKGLENILDSTDMNTYIEKGGNVFRAIFFVLMKKGYIVPITDGDRVLGFSLVDSHVPLEPHEEYLLEKIREAARIDVPEDVGLLSKILRKNRENLAKVMNKRDPENTLLPEEFQWYLKQEARSIVLSTGKTVEVPKLVEIAVDIMRKIKESRDIPTPLSTELPKDAPSMLVSLQKISQLFLLVGIGCFASAALYYLIGNAFFTLIGVVKNVLVLFTVPIFIPLLMFIIALMKPATFPQTWLNEGWWKEFLSWYKVEKWIKEFTRIARKDISAYETLNWDNYYLFAALRGLERLLIKALKITGLVERNPDVQHVYLYSLSTSYMYDHSWTPISREFVSAYHKSHMSGTYSGGSSTGSSFGGGSGGGGGSTGW